MLNTIKKHRKSRISPNDENYKTYNLPDDKSLFFQGFSFTPKNSFYRNEHQKLDALEKIADKLIKNEPEFYQALTWWFGKKIGLRLTPTILSARLALTNTSEQCTKVLSIIINQIFTRPDFIANFLSYYKFIKGNKSILPKDFPLYLKEILKNRLASFSELTLKKQKMYRRDISLADLIKTLRPRPKNEEMSKLYKSIIEHTSFSALKVEKDESGKVIKADHVTAVLSDETITKDKKEEFVSENILTIPINALIKNLSKLKDEDATILLQRLESVFSSGSALRYINPFDLIILEGEYEKYSTINIAPKIIEVLDYILRKYVTFNIESNKPLILFDISGSMSFTDGKGLRNGIKYFSAINNLFQNPNALFYAFDTNIKNITIEIKDIVTAFPGPNMLARNLYSYFDGKCQNGTAILKSMQKALSYHPDVDSIIIITDEETWAEEKKVEAYKNIIPSHLYGKVIIINIAQTENTIIKPAVDIIRMSGLDGKILNMTKAILNFQSFKQDIISEFKNIINS